MTTEFLEIYIFYAVPSDLSRKSVWRDDHLSLFLLELVAGKQKWKEKVEGLDT